MRPIRDHRRRSFVGLTLGNLGQQPWMQVVGPYLTLLVASRTASAVAITFALSAHRAVAAVVLPLAGRLSDRTRTSAGRRVPFIVAGTTLAAVCVAAMTRTSGYWGLVACVVGARVCLQVAAVGRIGVTPDVFGRSRWAKAAGAIAIAGFLPGIATLVLIRGTWRQDDPATWTVTFLLAAAGLLFAALAVGSLVREAPATDEVAQIAAEGSWRDEIARVLSIPNGRRLLAAGALLAVAMAATGRLMPVWARDELGVGGSEFATLSFVFGALSVVLVPAGLLLGSRAHPRTLAVSAALVGATAFGLCSTIHDVRWFVALTALAIPLTVGAVVSLVPQMVPLFPKGDRLGQAFGMTAGPFGLLTSGVALLTAVVVDAVGSTRVMWVISAALLLVLAGDLSRLRLPAGARTDVRGVMRRARKAGLGRGLFDGSVDLEDVLGIGSIDLASRDDEPTGPQDPDQLAPGETRVLSRDASTPSGGAPAPAPHAVVADEPHRVVEVQLAPEPRGGVQG